MRRRANAIRQQEIARTLKLLRADADSELAARLDAMTNALVKKIAAPTDCGTALRRQRNYLPRRVSDVRRRSPQR